jgi:hypothetical protein
VDGGHVREPSRRRLVRMAAATRGLSVWVVAVSTAGASLAGGQ